jgi:hypothetical protein
MNDIRFHRMKQKNYFLINLCDSAFGGTACRYINQIG